MNIDSLLRKIAIAAMLPLCAFLLLFSLMQDFHAVMYFCLAVAVMYNTKALIKYDQEMENEIRYD